MNIFTPFRKIAMPDISDFISVAEAAEKLGFTVQGVSRMIRQKRLEAVRVGRTWLVSKKSVAEYLKKTDGMRKNDPRRKSET